MQKHTQQDSWWHERPTKAAELDTQYQRISNSGREDGSVWLRAAFVVGLMFALALALVSTIGR